MPVSTEYGRRIERALQVALVNSVLGNERIAREFGLLVTDMQALHLLVLREDVRTPKELSAASGLPTSTITRVLDRLEEAGYVRRASDPQDRRRLRIELVEERLQPVLARYREYTEALNRINSEFTDSELAIVARYLERSGGTFNE